MRTRPKIKPRTAESDGSVTPVVHKRVPMRGRFFSGNKAMKSKSLHVKAVASF